MNSNDKDKIASYDMCQSTLKLLYKELCENSNLSINDKKSINVSISFIKYRPNVTISNCISVLPDTFVNTFLDESKFNGTLNTLS